jgi:hypothetical protein
MWSSLVKTDWLTGSYFELPSVRLLNYFELCVDGFEPSGGTLYFWKYRTVHGAVYAPTVLSTRVR